MITAVTGVEYEKLAGSWFRLGSSQRLYATTDHLLCIESNGYSERYYRLYLANILALTVRKSSAFTAWTLGYAGVMAVCIPGLAAGVTALQVASGGLAGVAALLLLIHVLRGSMCVCVLHTAAQRRTLTCLRRRRMAKPVLDEVRTRILSAQNDLPPIDQSMVAMHAENGDAALHRAAQSWPSSPWLSAAAAALTAQAICMGLMLILGGGASVAIALLTIPFVLCFALLGFVACRTNPTGIKRPRRTISILAISYELLISFGGYMYFIFWMISSAIHDAKMDGAGLAIMFARHLGSLDNAVGEACVWVLITVSLLLGAASVVYGSGRSTAASAHVGEP